jgi:predicted DNA-binding transcriptional regulator AlpA
MSIARDGTTQRDLRVVLQSEVKERVKRSRAQIHRMVKAGLFPAPFKLGPNTLAWTAASIDLWIADRIAGKPLPIAGSAIAMTAEARALLEKRRRRS